MRLLALCLCLLVACAGAPARAADNFSPAQTKAIERIVHDYLVKHPEVLMEAIQAADDKDKADKQVSAEQTIRDRHNDLYNDPDAQIGGNPKGDVTIVEFFDYRCPYCKQVQPALETLLKSDPKLRIVYKEFPILGPASVYAAKMALASRAQGKYLPFHDAMMATKGTIDEKVVDRVAAGVGIDVAKAKAAMDASQNTNVIKKDYALADALNINGTPAFILGGKLIPGAMSIDDMKSLIAAARQAHAG
ncbi:MAG TPA: DsbA family protein [Stellaceae bacterium]|jgi:protein-disulfide isomerase|nr:DsbA family protein [Stellaceae bacterium]